MAYFNFSTPFGSGSSYDPFSSILEVGVNNGIGNLISGYVGNYFGGKSSKKALKRAQEFASWQAQNLPSLQKQGLIKAGYNPLLALGGTFGGNVGSSAFQTFHSMANLGSSGSGSASITPYEGKSKKAASEVAEEESKQSKLETEILKMEKDAQESETSARAAQAYVNEMEAEATATAITGTRPLVYVDGKPTVKTSALESAEFDKLVDKLKSQIERDAFINSKEHAIYEDTIKAIHGINEGSSAYEHWRSGRRTYTPYRRNSRR